MRILGTVLLVAASAVGGSVTAYAADGPPDEQCQSEWSDLAQLHGENGNPDGPVGEVNAVWDDYAAQARARASSATATDCGAVIETFASNWDDLESFQYDLYAFDPRGDLRRAEADRRHYVELNGRLPRDVRRAFVVVRKHTQPAVKDLRPVRDDAPSVDFTDRSEVRAFLRKAHRVKRDSVHIQRMRHPYRVIGDAELDEE